MNEEDDEAFETHVKSLPEHERLKILNDLAAKTGVDLMLGVPFGQEAVRLRRLLREQGRSES